MAKPPQPQMSQRQAAKYRAWKAQLLAGEPLDPPPSTHPKYGRKDQAMLRYAQWVALASPEEKAEAHRRRRAAQDSAWEREQREQARWEEKEKAREPQIARLRKCGARLERMIETRLQRLGVVWRQSGYRFKWGSGHSRYWHVYVAADARRTGDRAEPRQDTYLGTIRLSDHESPPGGGFSVERQDRMGDADLSIDPSGGWIDEIEPLVLGWIEEAAR